MKIAYEAIRVRLGGRDILKGVTLSAEEGRITGIIGPNGCGKSTLVKTTFGICTPISGRVLVDGREAAKLPPRALAALVGYVGQDAECVFDFSVAEVVSMGLYARRDGAMAGREAVERAMEELGISGLAKRSVLSLSGGERKLTMIARAVAQGADALILDEPTNHLDIRHQLFLLDYLKRSGRTVLIVLHDLRLAAHYCDHLYLLSDGRVAAHGAPPEVLTLKTVERVFGIQGSVCRDQRGQLDFSLFSACEEDLAQRGKKT